MILFDSSPQGSEGWKQARRGRVTASRFKDARDRLKSGAMSKACLAYAMDVARERVGGRVPEPFQSAAMRTGSEQESIARLAYECETGNIVREAGLAYTEDGKFAVSVDGLVGDDGIIEVKTMVSSDTLFTAVVDGDASAYIDQINGGMWLTGRKWCDLVLWAPDMPPGLQMTIIRIERDDDAIEALEADLVAFERLVSQYEQKLAKRLAVAA